MIQVEYRAVFNHPTEGRGTVTWKAPLKQEVYDEDEAYEVAFSLYSTTIQPVDPSEAELEELDRRVLT